MAAGISGPQLAHTVLAPGPNTAIVIHSHGKILAGGHDIIEIGADLRITAAKALSTKGTGQGPIPCGSIFTLQLLLAAAHTNDLGLLLTQSYLNRQHLIQQGHIAITQLTVTVTAPSPHTAFTLQADSEIIGPVYLRRSDLIGRAIVAGYCQLGVILHDPQIDHAIFIPTTCGSIPGLLDQNDSIPIGFIDPDCRHSPGAIGLLLHLGHILVGGNQCHIAAQGLPIIGDTVIVKDKTSRML